MRKKAFKTLAFSVLFCLLLTVAVFAEDAEITASDVNFRTGPGTEYAIYECLPKGTVVTVTDRSDDEWYGVTYGDRSGFIYSRYLKVSAAPADAPVVVVAEDPKPEPQNTVNPAPAEPSIVETPVSGGAGSGTVNAMYVRLRSGPSTEYSILGEYNSGTALSITAQSGDWYAVTIGAKSGYMYADYVNLSGGGDIPVETPVETPAPTPVPTPAPTPVPQPVVVQQPETVESSGSVPGHIKGDYVYFRSGPSTSYSIFETLDNGTTLTITGTSGEWRAVTIDGRSGYVYGQYVVSDGGAIPTAPVAEPEPEPVVTPVPNNSGVNGYITGNDVRFRSGPSTKYAILGTLNYGNAVTITGSSGEWKAVTVKGESGYVYGQYVSEGKIEVIGESPNASPLGKQIVEYALQYEGCAYVWGGTSPDGFDCSGFTTYVFRHFGIQLNRVADDQRKNGVKVDNSALQPGDLLHPRLDLYHRRHYLRAQRILRHARLRSTPSHLSNHTFFFRGPLWSAVFLS